MGELGQYCLTSELIAIAEKDYKDKAVVYVGTQPVTGMPIAQAIDTLTDTVLRTDPKLPIVVEDPQMPISVDLGDGHCWYIRGTLAYQIQREIEKKDQLKKIKKLLKNYRGVIYGLFPAPENKRVYELRLKDISVRIVDTSFDADFSEALSFFYDYKKEYTENEVISDGCLQIKLPKEETIKILGLTKNEDIHVYLGLIETKQPTSSLRVRITDEELEQQLQQIGRKKKKDPETDSTSELETEETDSDLELETEVDSDPELEVGEYQLRELRQIGIPVMRKEFLETQEPIEEEPEEDHEPTKDIE